VKPTFLKRTLVVVLLIGLPVLGVILAGKPLAQYQEFPPVSRYVEHAAFSWPAFFAVALFVGIVTIPFVIRIITIPTPRETTSVHHPFPWWGYAGLGVLSISWALAWTRFPWFETLQPFTFTPLWIGYILLINALSFRRTGHCMLRDRPRYFLALFPLSAAFWWYFEYLNRFVQNWYYVGIADFTPLEYVVYATLPFSTVLPAVLGTVEWLESFPRLNRSLREFFSVRFRHPSAVSWLALLLGGAGLVGLVVWPDLLFPLLWISPLLIMLSVQVLFGEKTPFAAVTHGDWRAVWLPALAGLICGLLWELWNSKSLAHWQYALPFMHRFQLFEMPLLGYAGYLPFGLECRVITDVFLGRTKP
jgi:hypothetical protein